MKIISCTDLGKEQWNRGVSRTSKFRSRRVFRYTRSVHGLHSVRILPELLLPFVFCKCQNVFAFIFQYRKNRKDAMFMTALITL